MQKRKIRPLKPARLALLALSLLCGCDELNELIQANQAPVIDRISALRHPLFPADTTTIRVEAHDPEGSALTYAWSAAGGTLSTTVGSHVRWSTPALAGDYKISVKVRDDRNGETEGSITLSVIALERPTVKITEPATGAFIPGVGDVMVKAEASHPNGIQYVEFRLGENLVVTDNSRPYAQFLRVEGLSGPVTIVAKAFRAFSPGEPGVDSVQVSVEGVTRL